jgi:hypothetical protein
MGLPILDIEPDDMGNLWFVAGTTPVKYDVDSERATHFDTEEFVHLENITRTSNGSIWATNDNYLFGYDRETYFFRNVEIALADANELPLRISKIFPLDTSSLLIGTQNHGVYE